MTTFSDNNIAQKQMEELKLFQDRFRRLFEHIPAIVFSGNGTVLQINQSAEKAVGLTRDEIVGKTLNRAGCRVIDEHGTPMPKKSHPWIRSSRSQTLVHDTITGLILPDKSCRWQQSTSMPMNEASKTNKLTITIFTDITKYRQSQTQLIQSQKMEAIGSLAAGLAHDFNNILNSMRAALQIPLLEDNHPGHVLEALKDIEGEIIRGAEITRQLLVFGKPSGSSPKKTHVNDVIRDFKRFLKRTMPKNVQIHLNLCKDEFSATIAQPQFEQVLMNLTINARDAMPRGGTLLIATSLMQISRADATQKIDISLPDLKPGIFARITVSDTGNGIDAAILSRMCEPFFTSKSKQGGTGLGLTIVYAIVNRSHGHITFESTPGHGTTATIYLPVKIKCGKSKKVPTSPSRHLSGSETVLVVDDERITTKSTSRFLERYGYKTCIAYDGVEALDVFSKNQDRIDLILLDMEMPEMGGAECLEKILAIRPGAKVITLSGHIRKHFDQWNPLTAGSKAFIEKPYDSQLLLRTIREILDDKPELC